jgi:iron complex transport system ATP-binding protein
MVTLTASALDVKLGKRQVVRGIEAQFGPGSLVGIIGPNGAGKSTFARALLGLIPPSGGDALVDGVPVARIARRDMARTIAYLPQGQTLHWPLTVERLVALGRLPHLAPMSLMTDDDRASIEDALMRADVAHLRARPVNELSGGERARVLLARALAVGAPGLIVDEPLASLDPGHQIDVMALLAREAAAGALVIAVLHDLTLASRYCDRLLLLDRGELVADGPPLAVLTAERLRAVYGINAMISEGDGGPFIVPLARDDTDAAIG